MYVATTPSHTLAVITVSEREGRITIHFPVMSISGGLKTGWREQLAVSTGLGWPGVVSQAMALAA